MDGFGYPSIQMDPSSDMRSLRPRRWLLVEQPGPWASSDPRESRMDAGRAADLAAWARDAGWRLRLIRRGPRRYRPCLRTCFLIDGTREAPRMRRHLVADVRDIMALAEAPADPAARHDAPLYTAVTRPGRGRRTAPLHAALHAHRPDGAWEISPAGGGPEPGALMVFPHAVIYQHVGPAGVPAVAAAHERGDIALPWRRGRDGDAWEVQVSEHLVRRSPGRMALADLCNITVARHGDDEATVAFVLDDAGVVEARVRRSRADEIGRPVCSGACGAAVRYELVSMRIASEQRGRVLTASGVA